MTDDSKATPRPWLVGKGPVIQGANRDCVLADYGLGITDETAEANAHLIVTAVNAHDALLAERDAALAEVARIKEGFADINKALGSVAEAEKRGYIQGVQDARAGKVSSISDVMDFARAILHGDDAHRRWLLEAAAAWRDGKSVPPPSANVGMAERDRLRQALDIAIEALRQLEAAHGGDWGFC